MSVSIHVEMRGHFDRPNRNVAEALNKAIEQILQMHGGQITISEHRVQHRPFLGDDPFTPEHTEKIELYGSYHAQAED